MDSRPRSMMRAEWQQPRPPYDNHKSQKERKPQLICLSSVFVQLCCVLLITFFFVSLLFDAGIQLSTDPEVMLEQGKTKWQVILTHYAGILAVAVVGLIIAIAVPITGFFICCCRCAGEIIALNNKTHRQTFGQQQLWNKRDMSKRASSFPSRFPFSTLSVSVCRLSRREAVESIVSPSILFSEGALENSSDWKYPKSVPSPLLDLRIETRCNRTVHDISRPTKDVDTSSGWGLARSENDVCIQLVCRLEADESSSRRRGELQQQKQHWRQSC